MSNIDVASAHPSRHLLVSDDKEATRNPKKGRDTSLFRVFACGPREEESWWKLQLDDSSLQADHCSMGSIICAQFGKDALDSTLYGFLGD